MSQTADQLQRTFLQIAKLCTALPEARLLPGDRQILGGHLFPGGASLVDCVAAALVREPALYGDLGACGQALEQQQAEADGWLQLRNLLQQLSTWAGDQYLSAQGGAIGRAREVLAVVHGEPLREGDPERPRKVQRREGLLAAQLLLQGYQRAIRSFAGGKRQLVSAFNKQRARALVLAAFERGRVRLLGAKF